MEDGPHLTRRPSEEEEDKLWDRIEGVRHQLTRSLNPVKLTPYLRQCRVIDEQDEEEVLNTNRFPTRTTQTGRLIDILRARGKRGSEALLESLEFYYPEMFSRLTGREPAQRCSIILDEEGPEGLTQFLMTEVRKQRCQGKQSQLREQQLTVRCQALQEEKAQLERRAAELQGLEQRHAALRAERDRVLLELHQLKDESYALALRYAQLSEEKNQALLRSRDLQLQVDQMKCRVSTLEEECSLVRKRSLKLQHDLQDRSRDVERDTVSGLQAENDRLKASLQELQSALQAGEDHVSEAGKILMEILEQDRKEALEGQQEQGVKIQQLQSELHQAEQLRDKYLQDMEDLQLRHKSVQKDCELYRQRMNTVLAQLVEIEKERDQAIQSRDQVQRQHGQSMVEKDFYRKQVRTLEEERDSTLTRLTHMQAIHDRLQGQLQRLHGDHLHWRPMPPDSLSLGSSWSQPDDFSSPEGCRSFLNTPGEAAWDLGKDRQRPPLDGRSKSADLEGSCSSLDDRGPKSTETLHEKEVNRLSTFPFPPGSASLLRRQIEEESHAFWENFPSGSGILNADKTERFVHTPLSSSSASLTSLFSTWRCSDTWTDKGVPSRQLIITLSGEDIPSHLRSADGCLGSDISIVGGSCKGIYVKRVKPGSEAEKAGLSEGCRLLKLRGSGLRTLSLEHCTKEVTHLYLQRFNDPAALAFELDNEGYQTLLKELDRGGHLCGDSFYVRAHLDIRDLRDPSALRVKNLEIFHVMDTMFNGRLEWFCARVDPLTQSDLDRGTIPNYNRAQQLLLIQQDSRRSGPDQKPLPKNSKLKTPGPRRISAVSNDQKPVVDLTSNGQGGKRAAPKPYSLLWPHQAQTRRPVIFSPHFLARGLIRCLLEMPASSLDFDLCPSEILVEEEFIASPGIVLARSIPPNQGECVRLRCIRECIRQNKHCLLELGVSAAKELIRNNIFPIVIQVQTTAKTAQRLRDLLEPPSPNLSALLQKAKLEADALSDLPYAWAVLDHKAWSRMDKMVKALRTLIFQEQPKLLWVEEDKLRTKEETLSAEEEDKLRTETQRDTPPHMMRCEQRPSEDTRPHTPHRRRCERRPSKDTTPCLTSCEKRSLEDSTLCRTSCDQRPSEDATLCSTSCEQSPSEDATPCRTNCEQRPSEDMHLEDKL